MRAGRWTQWLYRLALVAGGVPLIAVALVALYVYSPWGRYQARLRERGHMLGGLALACKLYAGDHDGAMPSDLRALFPTYVNSPLYLAFASDKVDYYPGATDRTNPATVLMRERQPDENGRQWEEHVDCSAGFVLPSAGFPSSP